MRASTRVAKFLSPSARASGFSLRRPAPARAPPRFFSFLVSSLTGYLLEFLRDLAQRLAGGIVNLSASNAVVFGVHQLHAVELSFALAGYEWKAAQRANQRRRVIEPVFAHSIGFSGSSGAITSFPAWRKYSSTRSIKSFWMEPCITMGRGKLMR